MIIDLNPITGDLPASEDHLKLLVDSIRDYAIFMVDISGHIVSWNKGAEAIKGYKAEEVIGKSISIFYSPEDLEKGKPAHNLDMAKTYGHHNSEAWRIRKDGTRFWADISFTAVYDQQGQLKGFAKITRDRTEYKKAQEQTAYQRNKEEQQLRKFNELLEAQVKEKTAELTMVFQRVSDGFMAFDKTGYITYANQKAAEMNKRRPEDLIGKNFWKLFPTAAQNEFSENFHRAFDTQQNIHFEMFSPSLQLWIECFMYPSEDGLSLFFHDISEKRKAEAAISRSSEELRQLASHLQDIREEERATIAREIHDELGQQLTGIKMDLSWIARRWNKQPDDPIGQKISGTLGLLDDTIKTVRRIATELRPSVLDDLGLVAAIEWQSQEFKKRSGINTHFQSSISEFNFEPSTSIGLFRICQESLTNVARHSSAKNVWISLDWIDDKLILLIRDDGNGISKKGTGVKKTLGLLGMKERALMMGGSLMIHSGEGKGLTLEITVPLKEPTLQ